MLRRLRISASIRVTTTRVAIAWRACSTSDSAGKGDGSSSALSTTCNSNNDNVARRSNDDNDGGSGFGIVEAGERARSISVGPAFAADNRPTPPSLAPMPPIGQTNGGLIVYGPLPEAVVPIKRLPLMLIEEVPVPPVVLTEIELLMSAWSEEFARHLFMVALLVRIMVIITFCLLLYYCYRTSIATERRLRGIGLMPPGLKIGSVCYFDFTENGRDMGRVVIGLLTENCPLYCEYFHRRCTGNGQLGGESFLGLRVSAIMPSAVIIMGDGRQATHDVPGFSKHYLPREFEPKGPWRGAISSIAYAKNHESPNFTFHLCSSHHTPQVFGVVLGGYDVLEMMSNLGVNHGSNPKREFVVEGCGELCTIDKTKVVPMPWALYDSVSKGYDEHKYGPEADLSLLVPPQFVTDEDDDVLSGLGKRPDLGKRKTKGNLFGF